MGERQKRGKHSVSKKAQDEIKQLKTATSILECLFEANTLADGIFNAQAWHAALNTMLKALGETELKDQRASQALSQSARYVAHCMHSRTHAAPAMVASILVHLTSRQMSPAQYLPSSCAHPTHNLRPAA